MVLGFVEFSELLDLALCRIFWILWILRTLPLGGSACAGLLKLRFKGPIGHEPKPPRTMNRNCQEPRTQTKTARTTRSKTVLNRNQPELRTETRGEQSVEQQQHLQT